MEPAATGMRNKHTSTLNVLGVVDFRKRDNVRWFTARGKSDAMPLKPDMGAARGAPPAKAEAADFSGRFREIISDPLNLLIRRNPAAGTVCDGHVRLRNGVEVGLEADTAYYGEFSKILVFNRGVPEPLEEYVFQEVLATLPIAPMMLELGDNALPRFSRERTA